MVSSWRITWRALAAVARKDAARDRLLSVFLYPWVLGSVALLVGTSWIPDWLWDLVGIARLRPSSPEVILRTWVCVGLAPAVWLGVRAGILSESRDGGWKLLRRLPVRPGLVLLAKAAQGVAVLGIMTGIGLLAAVTASSFGEISGSDALAAAAGLGAAVSTLYALCFLSALLGRHRLLVWASVGALFVSTGAQLEALPGGALFRLPLGPELLRTSLVSLGLALGFVVTLALLAGVREGRWLGVGAGRIRSVDLTRAGLLSVLLLAPWALSRPAVPPAQLAGPVLRGPSGLELEVEDLDALRSGPLLAALGEDLAWLQELGLDPAPLAVANAPELRGDRTRLRSEEGAHGLIMEAPFGQANFKLDSCRADAMSALLAERPGWRSGSARLLCLALPDLRACPERPDDDLWAAWALQRLEGPLTPWIKRWAELERRLGGTPARALARKLLEDFAERRPQGPEEWARLAAADPRCEPPPNLLEAGGTELRRRLLARVGDRLGSLPTLAGIEVEPASGALRYRARLAAEGTAPVTSARLVLRTTHPRTGRLRRGEALLGAPGFGSPRREEWATLTLPPGEVEWQLGLALPDDRGELVFASGRGGPR